MQLTCPHCGFSREIPAEKIPHTATMATCPKCQKKFNFRTPAADPIDILFETEKPDTQTPSPPLSASKDHPQDPPPAFVETGAEMDVPWESLEKYGVVSGFYQTIARVMKSPIRLFQAMPLGGGIGKPLVFYLILAEIEILFQFFWNKIGVTARVEPEDALIGVEALWMDSALVLLFYPFFLTLVLFLGTAVIHVCLKLVRGNSAGFEGTFKAVTYGSAPMILSIFPLVGQIIGVAWAFVTTLIAYKYVHRTTYPRVVAAILLPVVPILIMAILLVSFTRLGA
jgi:hypothetical protein